MPLDVLGRTRATLMKSTSSFPVPEGMGNLLKLRRDGDRALQLLLFNEESLVSTSHQLVLITSLPFVHTARRINRLDDSVNDSDWVAASNSCDLRSFVNPII
jgi:hypothetical protein